MSETKTDSNNKEPSSSTRTISLVIAGINGRMGRATLEAIKDANTIELVGAFGRPGAAYVGKTISELTGAAIKNSNELKVADNLEKCLSGLKTMPDVLIDNTEAESAVKNALAAIEKGITPVIGTSGLTEAHLKEIKAASTKHKIGALIVPNFSVGAILMINFAKQASRFFENIEIVETHKLGKLDAPSGTAMHTARVIGEVGKRLNKQFNKNLVKEHELLTGSRGGEVESGVRVHSLRLPGILSKQDVYFAGAGELLTLRHESHNTKCFEQGIVIAIKAAQASNEFVLGLDNIIEAQSIG